MWTKELFGTEKPIIAMLHLIALPGDPNYDPQGGMGKVIERARRELHVLQNGGVDAIMFSNEFSLPYLFDVAPCTVAAMAAVIGELKAEIKIPFGVDVLTDSYKVFDLAAAVEAKFVRGMFTGAFAGEFGLMSFEIGKVVRHRAAVGARGIKTLFTLHPEASKALVDRPVEDIVKALAFYGEPDAILVAGLIAGHAADSHLIGRVKAAAAGKIPVFANTGVRLENVDAQLAAGDGAVVGTTFKRDGAFYNEADEARVKAFMDKVKSIRGGS
ncbi:MAG: BtpA/SgcQ family protein [Spirochaetaceae bacterium]|nr:BtpA/SgcQ family protein [Spirochaetaceae bacterium]